MTISHFIYQYLKMFLLFHAKSNSIYFKRIFAQVQSHAFNTCKRSTFLKAMISNFLTTVIRYFLAGFLANS